MGPIYAAKCPWCRRLHDFRGLAGQELGGAGEGSVGVEYGAIWYCEEKDPAGNVVAGCRRPFRITEIKQVVMVKLEPIQIQAPRR